MPQTPRTMQSKVCVRNLTILDRLFFCPQDNKTMYIRVTNIFQDLSICVPRKREGFISCSNSLFNQVTLSPGLNDATLQQRSYTVPGNEKQTSAMGFLDEVTKHVFSPMLVLFYVVLVYPPPAWVSSMDSGGSGVLFYVHPCLTFFLLFFLHPIHYPRPTLPLFPSSNYNLGSRSGRSSPLLPPRYVPSFLSHE